MERECLICHKQFETQSYSQIWCSPECKKIGRVEYAKERYLQNKGRIAEISKRWYLEHRHPCPVCGSLISVRSKHCRKHATYARYGAEHYGWKGGRCKTGGYIKIQKPEHPRANRQGYVFEHIVIWEDYHRKPLPKGWVIHHLNGIKGDNRIVNLVAMPDKKHSLVIPAMQKRIQELEALLNGQGHLL